MKELQKLLCKNICKEKFGSTDFEPHDIEEYVNKPKLKCIDKTITAKS